MGPPNATGRDDDDAPTGPSVPRQEASRRPNPQPCAISTFATIEPATWEHEYCTPAAALATIALEADAPHVWGTKSRAALQVRMCHSSQVRRMGENVHD